MSAQGRPGRGARRPARAKPPGQALKSASNAARLPAGEAEARRARSSPRREADANASTHPLAPLLLLLSAPPPPPLRFPQPRASRAPPAPQPPSARAPSAPRRTPPPPSPERAAAAPPLSIGWRPATPSPAEAARGPAAARAPAPASKASQRRPNTAHAACSGCRCCRRSRPSRRRCRDAATQAQPCGLEGEQRVVSSHCTGVPRRTARWQGVHIARSLRTP